jgi:hypothetical protein
MSYIKNNLIPNEQIEYQARMHWFMFLVPVGHFAFGLLIVGIGWLLPWPSFAPADLKPHEPLIRYGVMGVGGLIGLYALFGLLSRYILSISTEFAVTNKRVIAKRGFISRSTLELMLNKVDGLSVDQSIIGRLFNFGTVGVSANTEKQVFPWIADPLRLRREIQSRQT